MQKRYWLFGLMLWAVMACGGDGDTTPTPDDDDDTPEPSTYENCLVNVSNETLEVVTWNIENFPVLSGTAEKVEEIIEDFDADVIALQEIKSLDDFDVLVDALDGWSGHVEHISGSSQRLAYLYKDSEITVTQQPTNLYGDFNNSDYNTAFTSVRRPLYMQIQHSSGMVVDLINVHMKCCSGSEDRRERASELVKEYIDQNLATSNVIFLGDFNDEITDRGSDNVFKNFIDDSDNFLFTTMEIAEGPSSGWSFPSWPSMIDQIVISNELFDNNVSTQVLKLEECLSNYADAVSDHRPVLLKLSTN